LICPELQTQDSSNFLFSILNLRTAGLATPLGEIFYDKVLVPAADKTDNWLHEFIIDPIAHFESSLENWHP